MWWATAKKINFARRPLQCEYARCRWTYHILAVLIVRTDNNINNYSKRQVARKMSAGRQPIAGQCDAVISGDAAKSTRYYLYLTLWLYLLGVAVLFFSKNKSCFVYIILTLWHLALVIAYWKFNYWREERINKICFFLLYFIFCNEVTIRLACKQRVENTILSTVYMYSTYIIKESAYPIHFNSVPIFTTLTNYCNTYIINSYIKHGTKL